MPPPPPPPTFWHIATPLLQWRSEQFPVKCSITLGTSTDQNVIATIVTQIWKTLRTAPNGVRIVSCELLEKIKNYWKKKLQNKACFIHQFRCHVCEASVQSSMVESDWSGSCMNILNKKHWKYFSEKQIAHWCSSDSDWVVIRHLHHWATLYCLWHNHFQHRYSY